MSKLKPCPFCAGKAKFHIDCFHNWSVFCTNIKTCNAKTLTFKHRSSASNAWNNRTENEHLRLKEEECKELARDKTELVEALSTLFNDYKQFADSGDAGNWRLEDQEVGKLALSALEKHQC